MNAGYLANSHCTLFGEKLMNNFRRVVFALAMLSAASSTASFASSMYFVQGLAGRNYAAATDPAFPVDILLNDEVCYLHGLSFGNILGPVTFEPEPTTLKSASPIRWRRAPILL
jgi:hypothetical protein